MSDCLGQTVLVKQPRFILVVGLIKADEGKVFLDNQEITNQAMYQRARKGVGYLPQEASVFRNLTVEDNIKAVLELTTMSKQEQVEQLESFNQ